MSAANNRKFLVGFGAVAAVLIVMVAVWRPHFPPDTASGAIGAVQKHHSPQISKTDVILGDEKTHREQQVLFGDSFADATRLQKVALQLGNIAEAESAAASNVQLRDAEAQLQQMSAELQSRYTGTMSAAVASMEQMFADKTLASSQLVNMRAEAAELSAALRSQQNLSSAEMEQLATRLASFGKELQSREQSEALASANRDLVNAVAEMGSSSALASAKLESVAAALNAGAKLSSVSLSNYAESLESMAVESKSLNEIEMQLASNLASAGQVASAVKGLAAEAAALESHALLNVEEQMASQTHMASALSDMEMQLASARQAANKDQAASKELMNQRLGSLELALASREAEFRNRAAGTVSSALASFDLYLAGRAEMAARLGSNNHLQAQAMAAKTLGHIDAGAELAARLASVSILQSNLASIEKNLESRSALGSMLAANQQQFAAHAQALEQRATSLQAHDR